MARKGKNQRFGAELKQFWGVVVALCALLLSSCGQGTGDDRIELAAVLNNVDIATSSPSDPITLTDRETAQIELTMQNVSGEAQSVRYVRFEGQAIDMVFLTYDTAVRVDIAAGETRALPPVLFDFFDLGSQANGYLRGEVQLYDEARELLGSEQVFLDADGSGFSTLSWFNLLLLIGTGSGLAWNLMRLAQRRLPSNRFVRALRFMAIGAGAGLTLAVAFSTLRIWPLDTLAWVLFTVVGAIAGYLVGFALPGADDDIVDILDEQDVLDAVVDEQTEDALAGDGRATIQLH